MEDEAGLGGWVQVVEWVDEEGTDQAGGFGGIGCRKGRGWLRCKSLHNVLIGHI